MDKNSQKILNFIIQSNATTISELSNQEIVPIDMLIEIIANLKEQNFIKFTNDGFIRPTNKGSTYKSTQLYKWLSEHLIETLALIISVLAFIEATIALIL
jgi:predicted methyltransferase